MLNVFISSFFFVSLFFECKLCYFYHDPVLMLMVFYVFGIDIEFYNGIFFLFRPEDNEGCDFTVFFFLELEFFTSYVPSYWVGWLFYEVLGCDYTCNWVLFCCNSGTAWIASRAKHVIRYKFFQMISFLVLKLVTFCIDGSGLYRRFLFLNTYLLLCRTFQTVWSSLVRTLASERQLDLVLFCNLAKFKFQLE